MKLFISILSLAFFSLLMSSNLSAQNDEQTYVVVEYMKVKPGMMDKYRECEKAWKMIHEARKEAGYIMGWDLERVMYPNGSDAEYDFVVTTQFKNWNAIDAEDWGSFKKFFEALPKDQAELADQANEYRDIVKREIWTAIDMVFAEGATNPKYRVENFMSIPEGGWEKWAEMETEFAKPFIEKSVEMGNRAGWLIGSVVAPRGNQYPYQVSSMDFYNSWEDMNKDDGKAWEAVYGDMDYDAIGERINSTRSIVRSEVRVLVDSVD